MLVRREPPDRSSHQCSPPPGCFDEADDSGCGPAGLPDIGSPSCTDAPLRGFPLSVGAFFSLTAATKVWIVISVYRVPSLLVGHNGPHLPARTPPAGFNESPPTPRTTRARKQP
jgi:hypothetical protein